MRGETTGLSFSRSRCLTLQDRPSRHSTCEGRGRISQSQLAAGDLARYRWMVFLLAEETERFALWSGREETRFCFDDVQRTPPWSSNFFDARTREREGSGRRTADDTWKWGCLFYIRIEIIRYRAAKGWSPPRRWGVRESEDSGYAICDIADGFDACWWRKVIIESTSLICKQWGAVYVLRLDTRECRGL
jgi:hypothetical protein